MRLALLIALSIGCSDPARPAIDAAGSTDSPTADASTDAPVDAPPAPCPAGQLCLRVNPVAPTIPDGRLIVVFYQLVDDWMPYPPFVLPVDIPFSGSATAIELPLASITLPSPIDDYYVCPRTCGDLSNPACDCPAAQAKIALAFVMVMVDANTSGAIEPAELVDANQYGVGWMQLGVSDAAYPVGHALDVLAPEGIQSGLAPYEIIDLSPFDKLGIPPPGTTFDLDVCTPNTASCDLVRFPNLT
jgi:hypothetical protein